MHLNVCFNAETPTACRWPSQRWMPLSAASSGAAFELARGHPRARGSSPAVRRQASEQGNVTDTQVCSPHETRETTW